MPRFRFHTVLLRERVGIEITGSRPAFTFFTMSSARATSFRSVTASRSLPAPFRPPASPDFRAIRASDGSHAAGVRVNLAA